MWSIILLFFLFGGCHRSSVDVKELISSQSNSYIYMNINCCQICKNDTVEVCYPYNDIVYCLKEDSLTRHLCEKIDDYILKGEIVALPENHFLLRQAITPDPSVDSVYALGYEQLLQEYFFCYNEQNKENSCCLDWLHSACENSVYFGHRSTPCYYKEGDSIMDENKQNYIISLLYKNHIYCTLDENGNICLLKHNLKEKDIVHIPSPIVEIR